MVLDVSDNRLINDKGALELLEKNKKLTINISGNPMASFQERSKFGSIDKDLLKRLVFLPEMHVRPTVLEMFFGQDKERAAIAESTHKHFYATQSSALTKAFQELYS